MGVIREMKMELFESWKLKFEHPDWKRHPELGMVDTMGIIRSWDNVYSLTAELPCVRYVISAISSI
jgi:hypothetical protein